MKNTKITFLYRDASNYKMLNEVILKGAATEEDKKAILESCDGEFFIPEQVGLDVERFGDITEDDHCWCELGEDAFSETDAGPTEDITVSELAERFRQAAGRWDDVKYAVTG